MRMDNILAVSINDVAFTGTAHAVGLKKLLFNGLQAESPLTQFAYGKLPSGEKIPAHQHETMEEYFYFLKGSGFYTIGANIIRLEEGKAVKIPAGTEHILEATIDLEFVYFGIAVH